MNKCKNCGRTKEQHIRDDKLQTNLCKQFISQEEERCRNRNHNQPCSCSPNSLSKEDKDPDDVSNLPVVVDSGSDFILSDKILYGYKNGYNSFKEEDVIEFIRRVNKLSVADFLDGGVDKLAGSKLLNLNQRSNDGN